MSPSEWVKVAAKISALWPHSKLPEDSVEVWYDILSDLPAEQVVVAVVAIARSGREFAPPAGVIRSKVMELSADAPDWGPVWQELMDAVRSLGYTWQADDDGNLYRDDERWVSERVTVEGLDQPHTQYGRKVVDTHRHQWSHPLVGALVKQLGWQEICTFKLGDLRTIEAQSRNKFAELVDRDRQDRIYIGLPSVGLPRLERGGGFKRLEAS